MPSVPPAKLPSAKTGATTAPDSPVSGEGSFGPFANRGVNPDGRAQRRLDAVNTAFRAHHQMGERLPDIDAVLVSARKIISLVEDTRTIVTTEESA